MAFLIGGFRRDLLLSRFFLRFTTPPHGPPRPCGLWRRKTESRWQRKRWMRTEGHKRTDIFAGIRRAAGFFHPRSGRWGCREWSPGSCLGRGTALRRLGVAQPRSRSIRAVSNTVMIEISRRIDIQTTPYQRKVAPSAGPAMRMSSMS